MFSLGVICVVPSSSWGIIAMIRLGANPWTTHSTPSISVLDISSDVTFGAPSRLHMLMLHMRHKLQVICTTFCSIPLPFGLREAIVKVLDGGLSVPQLIAECENLSCLECIHVPLTASSSLLIRIKGIRDGF
jgi:hypothetical protein